MQISESARSKEQIKAITPSEMAPWPAWWSVKASAPFAVLEDRLTAPSDVDRIPVIRGIPRFVSNEGYAGNFGEQWKRFRATQLDSYTGFSISRDRLRRCLGEELWSRLSVLQVLEIGCGAGRFTEILLAEGAYVTSIDLSEAVDANAENFPVSERHRVAQANLLALPFAPQGFDIVLCLGVLQHTPSPEDSVVALASHVREGGTLVIDHYTWDWGRVTSTRPLVRAILRRMRSKATIAIVSRMVDFFLPWHRRLRSTTVAWSLLCRISPITTFYKLYPALPDSLQREWALLDTHDSLTDWYKHLRSREQVDRMINGARLATSRCEYAGNGVEATGVRVKASK